MSRTPAQDAGPTPAESAGRGEESLVSGYPGRVFSAVALSWAAVRLGRGVLSPLLPAIIDGLGITPFMAGFALTVMSGLSAVNQYLGGRVADALSRKTALVLSLGVLLLGLVLLSNARGYPGFVLGVAVLGAGGGLFFMPMRATLADLYVERRGRAFGINESVGSAGTVLAAGLAVVVIEVADWRAAFLPSLVLVGAGLLVLHRWHREPYVVGRPSLDLVGTARRVLGTRYVRRLLLSYALVSFVMWGVFGFLPTFLQAEKGFSPTLASASYATLFLTSMVAMPVTGTLSDRFPRTGVAAGTLVLAVVGLVVVVAGALTPAILLGVVLVAAGLLGYPPAIQAGLMDHFPDGSMGGDFGGFKMIYIGAGSLGPSYVGYVAGAASYTAAFAGLAGCVVASVLVLGWVTLAAE